MFSCWTDAVAIRRRLTRRYRARDRDRPPRRCRAVTGRSRRSVDVARSRFGPAVGAPPSNLPICASNLGRRSRETAVAPPRSGPAGLGGAAPVSRIRMSRTDAHAAFRVCVARREVSVVPVHRCADRERDLPHLDPGWSIGRVRRCYWQWLFTGTGVCSCWMCHWPKRRHPRRSGRGARRAQLDGVVREWNGGDEEAGWEV